MLILTRQFQEGVVCTDKVTGKSFRIVINSIGPRHVRLGFEDPQHNFNFRRDEVPDNAKARDDA